MWGFGWFVKTSIGSCLIADRSLAGRILIASVCTMSVGCSDQIDTLSTSAPVASDSVIELPLPAALVSLRALTPASLSLQLVLDDGPPRVFNEQGVERWSVTFNATSGEHIVDLSWYENYQGVNLLLASQQVSFTVGTQPVELTLDNSYVTVGPDFDSDGDGSSNLDERLLDTNPLVAELVTVNINEPDLVEIAAGCFVMGSPPEEPGRDFNEPQTFVCVDAFSMGKYEITFSQYDVFATETGLKLPDDYSWGRGNQPAILMNWYEAVAYTEWLSTKTGQTWRLPTEAEWEYAARAGTETPFSTGSTIVDEQANFNASATYGGSSLGVSRDQTTPVGIYAANPWGLHDMHGNVAEYTCSPRATDYSGNESICVGTPSGQIMVRGGSWRMAPVLLRSGARDTSWPTQFYFDQGFRVVREN